MTQPKHFPSKAEIARTFGVNPKTVGEWSNKPTFPLKGAHGWNRLAVMAWIDEHRKQVDRTNRASGNRQVKIDLECARLRIVIRREKEKLTQEELETMRIKGKVHDAAECDKESDRCGAALRYAVDSWQAHNVAKMPDAKELIDDLCATFLAKLHALR